MNEFHFMRPWWLLALLLLVLLGAYLQRRGRDAGDWRELCDPDLLPHILVQGAGGGGRRFGVWLWWLGGVLAVLALAGPVWQRVPAPALRNEAALVIALDLSRTMDAADAKPSRLARARFKIEDILRQRKDGLTALLVYSGDAYTVTPLTDDVATIKAQIEALTSDLMPTQGGRADLALERAWKLLGQAGLTQGDILLITHGVNLGKSEPAAAGLRASGYRLSILGVGSEEGAPVPLPEGGYLQDTRGQIVLSQLATPALRQLAATGGGLYRTLGADDADVAELTAQFAQQARAGAGSDVFRVEQWREQGPWLLLGLLPLAALAFRRGVLWVFVSVVLAQAPVPSHAEGSTSLWQTPDQRASRAYAEGRHAEAASTFSDPAWKGAALYRAGDYAEAARALESLDTAEAHYNRGNALAKQGLYLEALAAYDRALALSPQHADAKYNKELVEHALQQQQEQKKEKPGDGQQDQAAKQRQDAKPENGQNGGERAQEQQANQEKSGENRQERRAEQNSTQKDDMSEGENAKGRGEKPRSAASETSAAERDRPAAGEVSTERREQQQAGEQWLRRIPDDPGGLLRRKFYYQYQQRQGLERRP
ncbi:VWA domain-containing protein [Methylococcus sp. EFPC2]|uniref:VWA domain-containing protein n=1 Tax=Methylococcus sp. EFPC2 TaxID=2812648 RepID=UPI0019677F16|nr:VWA domain-containing protein [Methylococcus sp. EFPC2]QSA96759.1 VWA domain-containing protein [Methylococcus sp. EFPC2]